MTKQEIKLKQIIREEDSKVRKSLLETNETTITYKFSHDFYDGEDAKSRAIRSAKEASGSRFGKSLKSIKMIKGPQSKTKNIFSFKSKSLEDLKEFKERLTHSWNELDDETIYKSK